MSISYAIGSYEKRRIYIVTPDIQKGVLYANRK